MRGVGYAVGFKNVGFSEGFDDYSTARVRLSMAGGEPLVEVHTAAAEVGQGLVTVMAQIARTELGVENVLVLPADTQVGSAGLLERLAPDAHDRRRRAGGVPRGARGVGARAATIGDGHRGAPASTTTGPPSRSTSTGQGDAHVTFAFAAHRAVVDVDTELGLVRVVEIATAQDVGKAMNPLAVEGQIEGGIAQGLGLALMEEIQVVDGLVRNASFTDYLIPTMLDMPPVELDVLELGDPDSPYGLRGIGEPPTISSTPAVVAALRAATGPAADAGPGAARRHGRPVSATSIARRPRATREPDTVIEGARVFSAFTREWLDGDVAIADGRIAGVGAYEGGERIDAGGQFLVPGLHRRARAPGVGQAHARSQFARAVVPRGTTAVVCDPHEIANVAGVEGVDWLLGATEGLPLDVFVMAPSCVPASRLRVAVRAARAGRDAARSCAIRGRSAWPR